MARLLRGETKKIGTAPGSLIFVGIQRTEKVRLDVSVYNKDSLEHFKDVSADEVAKCLKPGANTWINVIGLHSIETVEALGNIFNIHALLLEDILNTNQRPKFDSDEQNIALFLKMLKLNEKSGIVESEQVSIVFGKNYLISFQEADGDVFDGIRERMNKPTSKMRQRNTDYLAFALMDSIVDNYILSIEYFGDLIEKLIDVILKTEDKSYLQKINSYRREINTLRRTIRPVVEITNSFEKSESALINKKTIPFIKDLEDHTLHAVEAVETYKELLNDELSIFHMTMGSKMNDILKVLTVFSVIFIPLTFLAGIYGTNFHYLPELEYRYAYPVFWGVLVLVAAGMLFYFKRKGWLG